MRVRKYKRGQIWWYDFERVNDYNSSLPSKIRPVVIVSNDNANLFSPVLIGIPCTTQVKKSIPTHLDFTINGTRSILLAENVSCLDIHKLIGYIGVVDEELMNAIDEKLLIATGLKECSFVKEPEQLNANSVISITAVDNEIVDIQQPDIVKTTMDACTEANENKDTELQKVGFIPSLVNISKRGRHNKYSLDDMISFISDYETHTIEFMLKKYDLKNKKAACQRVYTFRKKKVKGVS